MNSEKVKNADIANKLLRSGIRTELEAISLYEQMATLADNAELRKIFLDMVKEAKAHMGKLNALLLWKDKEQEDGFEQGSKKIDEIFSSSKATIKPREEQKTTSQAHSASPAEKPHPIPCSTKSIPNFREEQKPIKHAYSTVKPEKPHQILHGDTKSHTQTGNSLKTHITTICTTCGYKAKNITPNKCPICGALGEKFKRV